MNLREKLLSLDIFIENEYFDKYIDLVESNEHTLTQKYKTQRHHIIPRCYYTQNNLCVDNSSNNLVTLLFIDHVLAHCYLVQCLKDAQLSAKNMYAVQYMCNDQYAAALDNDNIKFQIQKAYETAKYNFKSIVRTDDFKRRVSEGLSRFRREHGMSQTHIDNIKNSRQKRKYERAALGLNYYDNPDHMASRCIACYCVTSDGTKKYFKSYKDAGLWWYETYKPFGAKYVEITLQRKIRESILYSKITYKVGHNFINITNIRWYKDTINGGDVNEKS